MTTTQSEAKSYKRLINGHPYVLTREPGLGYRVTANANAIDHVGRTYLVQVNDGGAVCRCSCGDHHHRKTLCKHMKAVQDLLREVALKVVEVMGRRAVAANCYPEAVAELRRAYRLIRDGGTPRYVLRRLEGKVGGMNTEILTHLLTLV